MIGLVLVSHGRLAEALLNTATEIVGPIEPSTTLAIERHQGCDDIEVLLAEAVQQVDRGQGVLILADMFGGTACNISLRLIAGRNVEVVTGFNLPMLLKVATEMKNNDDLQAIAQLLKYYGQRNIMVAGDVLKERAAS